MSIRRKFRRFLLVFALGLGVLAGSPIRPDEIERLMRLMNQTRIERVVKDENGEPPPLPRGVRRS